MKLERTWIICDAVSYWLDAYLVDGLVDVLGGVVDVEGAVVEVVVEGVVVVEVTVVEL